MPARVRAMIAETDDILRIELVPANGQSFPPPTPGAHIDLHLPERRVRQYSLTLGSCPARYVTGILKEKAGRGGSRHVHEVLRPGDIVQISKPRNAFALADGDRPVTLIAGGIGITPILAMADALSQSGRTWQLAYCARNRTAAAFLEELAAYGDPVRLRFDDEAGSPPDLAEIVADAPEGTDFYCCGPTAMLDAFCEATAGLPEERVHIERFTAARPLVGDGGFLVTLARSGETLSVAADQTILDALLDAGVEVESSCCVGICGTCETKVLEGVPDHRDAILTEEERSSNATMMVCCSRSKSPELVLDL
ncbi:oxidoreductase [Amorphus sp. 3PC139-8]